MIVLARLVDPRGPQCPQGLGDEGRGSRTPGLRQDRQGQISRSADKDIYPDATFTLRLAFGTVKGYEEDGKQIPFETTFAGLYERSKEHHDKAPFDLPPRWVERKDKLDSEDAVQLRVHGRHHRRQLGQPGDQPQRAKSSA